MKNNTNCKADKNVVITDEQVITAFKKLSPKDKFLVYEYMKYLAR